MKTRIVLAVLSVALTAAPTGNKTAQMGQAAPRLEAYQGLGAWLDIYNAKLYRQPNRVADDLLAHGVRTLYLQTTNYRRRGPFQFPKSMGLLLEAAHARGIRVVAWYLPDFVRLKRDLRWSLAAIRYRSPSGQQFDSFGLDIESSVVKKYWVRNQRLLRLSAQIREAAGPEYPLAAIVPSARMLQIRPDYWPGFPFARLAGIYDVFLPMSYYSYRDYGSRAVHAYIAETVELIRRKTGDTNIPIHLIGGIADGSNRSESLAFVRAARQYGLLGASMYDYKITGPEDWEALAQIQPIPVQKPAMPLKLWRHLDAYGNLPDGDRTHPAEVVFATGPLTGSRELDFEGFDIGGDEVDLYVNWRLAATIPALKAGGWGKRASMAIPDGFLRDSTPNVIAFVARARHPDWSTWGVRQVTLMPAPLPLTDLAAHGVIPGAGVRWADRVTYAFDSSGAPLSITVAGYDISAEEVSVLLNGEVVGKLSATPAGAWGPPETIPLSPAAGPNRLTFDSVANPPQKQTWGVQLISAS
jgi:hypothetical protein